MTYLHSFRTKKKLQSDKKVCENTDFFGALMLSEDTKTLEFKQYRKSYKTPSIINADLESLIKKVDKYKKKS